MAKKEVELKKGDAAKMIDLISDLENLKTKYQFKSSQNKEKYEVIILCINSIIDYLKMDITFIHPRS